jgi:hypothetical protein
VHLWREVQIVRCGSNVCVIVLCVSGRAQMRQVDKLRRVEDRRRHVTRYHENVRVIVEVKAIMVAG